MRIAADFTTETLKARRECKEIFQVMQSKDLQLGLLFPARITIKMDSKISSFLDRRNMKEYTSTKSELQDILKGLL